VHTGVWQQLSNSIDGLSVANHTANKMRLGVQIVVTSAIAVTLLVLLLHPAIISLEVRSTLKPQKFVDAVSAILSHAIMLISVSLTLAVVKPWAVDSTIKPIDEQALTCTRRC
jgi:hypothetical protein